LRPELFKIDLGFLGFDSISAPAYFLLLVTGFLFATAAGAAWARRIGQDPDVIVDLGLAALLAGVVGGRLLHVFVDGYFMDYVHLCTDPSLVDWRVEKALCATKYKGEWDSVKGVCHPIEADCFAWAKFWAGGLTYYGGLIGASLTAWWLLRRDKFPFWKAADMGGFAVPLGLGFGRMGCLLAGCCFGSKTDGALSLIFPGRSAAWDAQLKSGEITRAAATSLPCHPTQIYEAAASIGIAAFCYLWLHGRKRYDGQVFVAFIALYAVARFLIEFLRADDRGGAIGLSTSQLIGLLLVGVAYALHRKLGGPGAKTPPATPAAAAA
jgi:phosphatidylglycerol:prolipoprotein diacylglycerol transferase